MFIKNGMRRVFLVFMVLTLVLSMQGATLTHADEEDELRDDLKDVKNEKNAVSRQMEATQNEIYELEDSIRKLNAEIIVKRKEIQETVDKIGVKEKEMEERQSALDSRLRNMYKKGTVGFADVLLGSTSLSDFVSNVQLIQSIYEHDANVMVELDRQHTELEKIKKQLDLQEKELDGKAVQVSYQQKTMQTKMMELEAREAELEREAERISAEIVRLIDEKSKYVGGKFVWPVPENRTINSPFGYRIHPISGVRAFHKGIDIGARYGSDVVAAANGKVILAQWHYSYGNYVILDHGGGVTTLYAHNSKFYVSVGDVVTAGQTIAAIGSTGYSTGPHLHFEVRNGSKPVDPLTYFRKG